MTNRISRLALAGLVALVAAACAESSPTQIAPVSEGRFDNPGMAMKPSAADPSIVDIAIAASKADEPQFTILVQAVVAAGLVDVLDGKGQYTVFAPTDAAFVTLLGELGLTAEELLANTELLTSVLLYHVATGRRYAEDVLGSEEIRSLNGGFFFPGLDDDGAFLVDGTGERSNIVGTDIEASNGIIHVLDRVILPGS